MTQFDQNELEQTRIAIRYFLQQITNDDFNALCIIENKGLRYDSYYDSFIMTHLLHLRWTCGTKYFLSKLSADGIRTKSADVCEEIHKNREKEEILENDSDLFENESDSNSNPNSKWKFIGDCAFLLNEKEAEPVDNTQRTENRKR